MHNLMLRLGGNEEDPTVLTTYVDSDWGCDVDDRRSFSGSVFLLGSPAILWSTKKQPTVATSSTEGEYMALSRGMRHGLWFHQFLGDIGLDQGGIPTLILMDNLGAIELAKDARHHPLTKHINVSHHFLQHHVEARTFDVVHCPSHTMLADGLTKPIDSAPYDFMINGLGLVWN